LGIGLFAVIAPYVIGKTLIESGRLRVATARQIAVLGFAAFCIGQLDVITGQNIPNRIFDSFFLGQWHGGLGHRLGLPRVASMYSHSILFGLFMAVYYRFTRWLEWSGLWENKFPR